MKKSDINKPPCYFDKYIDYADDVEIWQAFADSISELETLDLERLKAVGEMVYAEGKWTIKDIFQHLIDVEHILAYRSLRIGRNDKTPLSGFDEAVLAANVSTKGRTLENIIDELKIARRTTSLLFESFTDEALQRIGISSEIRMTALAFGFTIVGHQKYHLKLIEEKYLILGI